MIGTLIAPFVTGFLREHMPVSRGYSCETYAHALRLLFAFAAERSRVRPSDLRLGHIDADLVVRSRQKRPCGRVNRPTKTRASG